MRRSGVWVHLGLFFLALALFFSSTAVVAPDVYGVNQTTTITQVNITNTQPTLYAVTVTPDPINLNPGTTTFVNCTGFVFDPDGASDVSFTNATFFDEANGDSGGFDNNFRYQNSSCSCSSFSAFNASCSCFYSVQYYANNGSWQCNMTAFDTFGLSSHNISGNATINTVLGLDTDPLVDYGNMSVTEISSPERVNMTNFGNVPLNLSVRGYGGTNTSYQPNTSLQCQQNNISMPAERFSLDNTTAYASMNPLHNTTQGINGLEIPVRTNDATFDTDRNQTYWRIQVPITAGGFCNGTIEFYANEA